MLKRDRQYVFDHVLRRSIDFDRDADRPTFFLFAAENRYPAKRRALPGLAEKRVSFRSHNMRSGRESKYCFL